MFPTMRFGGSLLRRICRYFDHWNAILETDFFTQEITPFFRITDSTINFRAGRPKGLVELSVTEVWTTHSLFLNFIFHVLYTQKACISDLMILDDLIPLRLINVIWFWVAYALKKTNQCGQDVPHDIISSISRVNCWHWSGVCQSHDVCNGLGKLKIWFTLTGR